MGVGNGAPVGAADRKSGRPAGSAAGAVNVEDLALRNAQVIAEGRGGGLGGSQFGLRDRRHAGLEILERFEHRGVKAGRVPFSAIERRTAVGVGADLLQSRQNRLLAIRGVHRFARREPVAAVRGRPVALVIGGRKRPVFHRRSLDRHSRFSARLAHRPAASASRRSHAAAYPEAGSRRRPFSSARRRPRQA